MVKTGGIALVVVGSLTLAAASCDSNDDPPSASRTPTTQAASTVAAGSEYAPDIDPNNFVDTIDNPLYPLIPGTVFKLRGETEDGVVNETITVTERTKEILGVTTTVVKDVERLEGEVAEFTYDWYAQDRDGNVWYFGEDTAEIEDGKVVSKGGSWEAGVDGALPGIIMNGDPQVTDSFRQEYYKGEAEDMYWVVAISDSVSIPYGDFDDVVRVLEWNPLEPKVVGQKFYAPGVGLVYERTLSGEREIVELVDVSHR